MDAESGRRSGNVTVFLRAAPTFFACGVRNRRGIGRRESFHFLFKCIGGCHGCFMRVVLNLVIKDLLRLILPFLARSVMSINVGGRSVKFI